LPWTPILPGVSQRREGDSNPDERGHGVVERGERAVSSDARQREATLGHVAEAKLADADEALRAAIRAALDAGAFGRVRALLDVLDPPRTTVRELARRHEAP